MTLPTLPRRDPNSHKGSYGRALLVGGSRGMSGAIGLAGMATLRSGAGLVTLAVPDCCVDVVSGFEPSYMTAALEADDEGRISRFAQTTIEELMEGKTCLAIGPGLGRSDDLSDLVGWMYRTARQPLVIDADALNALADGGQFGEFAGPRILTPHPGEFARIEGSAGESSDRELAVQFAARFGVVLVLKGHRTIVTDGEQTEENLTGNPGMATGGSGDVLTGVITALVCQGLDPWSAARLGVHVHGLAGDLAMDAYGKTSLIASDLIAFLPVAFQRLTQ